MSLTQLTWTQRTQQITPWSEYVCEKTRLNRLESVWIFFNLYWPFFVLHTVKRVLFQFFWLSTAVVYTILVFGVKPFQPRSQHWEPHVVVDFCIRLYVYRLRSTELTSTGTRRCSARSLIKTKLHSAKQWKDSACPRGFIRGGAALRSRFKKKPINYRLVPAVVIRSTQTPTVCLLIICLFSYFLILRNLHFNGGVYTYNTHYSRDNVCI